MEHDTSNNGSDLDYADEQADDTGLLAEGQGPVGDLTPLYDKVEQALVKDRPAAALIADLSPAAIDALMRQAHAATALQMIDARADISLAFQNAPKAFADTGSYSGVMPGPEAFASVFGVDEGGGN